MSFDAYYKAIRPRLGNRASGFDLVFKHLSAISNPLIVETGCARKENNFEGDGQSSLLFDAYVDDKGGAFMTVDISSDSVEFCRSKVSKNTTVVLGDSVEFLERLDARLRQEGRKIDLLYLDSMDAPRAHPDIVLASSKHHLRELAAIHESLGPGSLIGVDDCWMENGKLAGKGGHVAEHMSGLGIEPVHSGCQMFWRLP